MKTDVAKLLKKNLFLQVQDAPDKLNFDFGRIRQVAFNIVENAIRFANENLNIDVSFEDTADKLIVTIKDEGIPIPQQELETVFDTVHKKQ